MHKYTVPCVEPFISTRGSFSFDFPSSFIFGIEEDIYGRSSPYGVPPRTPMVSNTSAVQGMQHRYDYYQKHPVT